MAHLQLKLGWRKDGRSLATLGCRQLGLRLVDGPRRAVDKSCAAIRSSLGTCDDSQTARVSRNRGGVMVELLFAYHTLLRCRQSADPHSNWVLQQVRSASTEASKQHQW